MSFLQPIALSRNTLNGVKWVALLLMLIDHINKMLLSSHYDWMYSLGRISMPLFSIALGLNLASIGRDTAVYKRVCARLWLFGVLATPVFVVVNQPLILGWLPLNILFMFLCAVVIVGALESNSSFGIPIAAVMFVVGSLFVEFWWPGVLLVLSVWSYQRKPNVFSVIIFILSLLLISLINGNGWSFACIPVILLIKHFKKVTWQRAQLFFYGFYPAHLYLIWVVQKVL